MLGGIHLGYFLGIYLRGYPLGDIPYKLPRYRKRVPPWEMALCHLSYFNIEVVALGKLDIHGDPLRDPLASSLTSQGYIGMYWSNHVSRELNCFDSGMSACHRLLLRRLHLPLSRTSVFQQRQRTTKN